MIIEFIDNGVKNTEKERKSQKNNEKIVCFQNKHFLKTYGFSKRNLRKALNFGAGLQLFDLINDLSD